MANLKGLLPPRLSAGGGPVVTSSPAKECDNARRNGFLRGRGDGAILPGHHVCVEPHPEAGERGWGEKKHEGYEITSNICYFSHI